jgi:DNA mismatch endonuclease (patch repair protein)
MVDRLSTKARSALMSRVRTRNTAPELAVRSALHRNGYRFRLKRAGLPGRPDVILPGRMKVIFVHGCFWHGHSCKRGALPASNQDFWRGKIAGNRERDRRVVKQLRALGWRSLILWECELKDAAKVVRRLVKFCDDATL